MNRHWMRIASTLAVVLLSSAQAWAGTPRLASYLSRLDVPAEPTTCEDPKARLAAAAAEAGYPINVEETVLLSQQGVTVVVSSIAGYEHVPSSGFVEGADMGFMYLDDPASDIPTGYYRLSAHAPVDSIRVGDYDGAVRLINVDGATVASLPASFHTWSLDVPEVLPFPRTTVSPTFAKVRGFIEWTWVIFECPNGTGATFRIPRRVMD